MNDTVIGFFFIHALLLCVKSDYAFIILLVLLYCIYKICLNKITAQWLTKAMAQFYFYKKAVEILSFLLIIFFRKFILAKLP